MLVWFPISRFPASFNSLPVHLLFRFHEFNIIMRRLCERRSPVAQPFRPSGSRSFRLERPAEEARGNRRGARWQPLRISGHAKEGGWLTWKALFTCHRLRDYYESLFPHESESLRVHAFPFIDRAVFHRCIHWRDVEAMHWRETCPTLARHCSFSNLLNVCNV